MLTFVAIFSLCTHFFENFSDLAKFYAETFQSILADRFSFFIFSYFPLFSNLNFLSFEKSARTIGRPDKRDFNSATMRGSEIRPGRFISARSEPH